MLEVTARSAAELLGLQANKVILFYRALREISVHYLFQKEHEIFQGCVELDESYFGGVRQGKRGRGAGGKMSVFGILKRGGKIYTPVVLDVKSTTLIPIVTRKVAPDSLIYTDHFRRYNALDTERFCHQRINHSTHFGEGKNHLNGVENFWNQAKRSLRKYNGITPKNVPLLLKECEFRFNYGAPSEQLKILRKWCEI